MRIFKIRGWTFRADGLVWITINANRSNRGSSNGPPPKVLLPVFDGHSLTYQTTNPRGNPGSWCCDPPS